MTKEQIAAFERVEQEAREYLADAMRQPGEHYPPIFATYVEQGVSTASASVSVETAITAVCFALMSERSDTTP